VLDGVSNGLSSGAVVPPTVEAGRSSSGGTVPAARLPGGQPEGLWPRFVIGGAGYRVQTT
jgi:hypothetical protein